MINGFNSDRVFGEVMRRRETCCGARCVPADDCASVVASIALAEAGAAHILNAEGEKIQKMTEIAGSADDLIRVNESVSGTIGKIICLENILCRKLECAVGCGRPGGI
jgi:hypothetical protein